MTNEQIPSLTISDHPSMPEGFFDESKLFEDSKETDGEGTEDKKVEGTNESTEGNKSTDDSNEDKDFIRISRKDLAAELERLRVEDKDFAQVYNRDVGNKAAQKYKPEIDLLKKNNEALTTLVRQRELAAMPQDEVTSKFATDPKFAEEYASIIHAKPEIIAQPNEEQLARQLGNELNNVFGYAKRLLTEEQYVQLQKDAADGKFDVDETGEVIQLSNWQDAVERLQNHVVGLVKQPVVTTQPEVKQTPVQRQDTASPDVSASGGRGTQRQTYTMTQVRNMSLEKKFELFPGENGIEDAIANGTIILEGI